MKNQDSWDKSDRKTIAITTHGVGVGMGGERKGGKIRTCVIEKPIKTDKKRKVKLVGNNSYIIGLLWVLNWWYIKYLKYCLAQGKH